MSLIWNYFSLSGRVAFCKVDECNYRKEFPPRASTTNLISHLKTNHPLLHKEFVDKKSKKDQEQPKTTPIFFQLHPHLMLDRKHR